MFLLALPHGFALFLGHRLPVRKAFRPVRLFSLVVEQNEPALVLQRSLLVGLLDLAEAVFPVLTPAKLADADPSLSPIDTPWRSS